MLVTMVGYTYNRLLLVKIRKEIIPSWMVGWVVGRNRGEQLATIKLP